MEPRLLPMNALLGLVTPGDLNPAPLADAGFTLAALEAKVGVGADGVVVDVVLWHVERSLLVPAECKSGANIGESQARKYSSMDAQALLHATPVSVRAGVPRPTAVPLYVALTEHSDRIRLGLDRAGVAAAVLAVSRSGYELHDPQHAPPGLATALGQGPVELPVPFGRLIPCDQESPVEEVQPQVKAVLVAHLSRRTQEISVEVIAAETLIHLTRYGRAAKNQFSRKVADCCRRLAQAHPETFEFRAASGHHDAAVRFLRTPEDNDNRGRTQGYQALGRPGHTRRARRASNPNQMDLLQELGDADNVRESEEDQRDEEEQT